MPSENGSESAEAANSPLATANTARRTLCKNIAHPGDAEKGAGRIGVDRVGFVPDRTIRGPVRAAVHPYLVCSARYVHREVDAARCVNWVEANGISIPEQQDLSLGSDDG